MESCDAALPYTLIGLLLRQTATNALLWVCLISVTSLLCGRLARLVRLWVQGSRIPGPPSNPFLARSKLIPGCGSLGSLTGYLAELHEKYGSIAEDKLPLTGRAFHLAFGRSSLFVSSFEKVQERRESLAEYMNERIAVRANVIPSEIVECVVGRVDNIMAKENTGSTSTCARGVLFQEEMAEYLKEELSEVICRNHCSSGKTCKLDSDDVQKMNLLMATVYESVRLLPAGPLLQRCSVEHDIYLCSGVNVPAGAILVVPLQLVQMDSYIWGKDAGRFNPLRFLPEATDHIGPHEKYEDFQKSAFHSEPKRMAAFLPFGYGIRACIGEKFPTLGISTLIAFLLQNYEIKLQPGSENDPKPIMSGCILQLLPSPKVVFAKRTKSKTWKS
ncbi:hypothetical protein OPV22_026375 [Ensete ventricosum]|uniref:Uncharacterized protein n=1 Tax=Ensete ventricosum TaxID=4639 RepID=A0AAV8QHW6_ENSVE|nr:hypothetical protein OPV22_026375 [Ensete ventricosum]